MRALARAVRIQDELEILSQVELIKSEQLARAVVEKLKLTDDEEFMEGTPSLASYVLGGVGAAIDWVRSLLSSSAGGMPTKAPTMSWARRPTPCAAGSMSTAPVAPTS